MVPVFVLQFATVARLGDPTPIPSLNTNACMDVKLFNESSGDIVFLGEHDDFDSCNQAAAGWYNCSDPSPERCQSTCFYHKVPGRVQPPITNICLCRKTPMWMPHGDDNVDSAVLSNPCATDADCSYNGVCSSAGSCSCTPGWSGLRCGTLNLLPVNKSKLGFREKNSTTGDNVSTWGAPVIYDQVSKKWHGWTAEMVHGCGINAWESNSQIVHIVADNPLGPFSRKEVVALVFAHEPGVQRGPDGEWVMLYAGYEYNATGLAACVCTSCKQGETPPQGTPGCPFQRGVPSNLGHPMKQMMAISDSPFGPWHTTEIKALTMPWDWNTALTINADRSAVALIRGGMTWYSSNYSDNTTWHAVGTGEANDHGQSKQWPISVEDPYIWRDAVSGVYHAIAHCFSPFFSAHAFVDPVNVPTNWSDPTQSLLWTVTGNPYGNSVNFTDGSNFNFSRRERPHITWAPGKYGITPLALTNGVEYGTAPNTPFQDGTFSLMQAIVANL